MDKKRSISDAELEILEVLWDSDTPLTSLEIRKLLNEKKQWERTTVLTLIKRLVDKGAVRQEKQEVYYYTAVVKRQEYQKAETRNLIGRLYKGNTKDLVAALVQDNSLTMQDIDELRTYFNQNF